MKSVSIYTDGACSKNPGPGGWAAILMYNGHQKEISGSEPDTTNNRMELTAAIKGLEALNQPCKACIFTDSAYLYNGFTAGWVYNWLNNGWRTANKRPVENRDLWEELLKLSKKHSITWHKVKGHAENKYNNRCDELAVAEVKKLISAQKDKQGSGSEHKDTDALIQI